MIFWVLFPVFVAIWMGRWEVLVLVYLLMRASGDDWMEPSTMSKHGFCNSCRTGFWLGEVLGKRMAVFFVFLVTLVVASLAAQHQDARRPPKEASPVRLGPGGKDGAEEDDEHSFGVREDEATPTHAIFGLF